MTTANPVHGHQTLPTLRSGGRGQLSPFRDVFGVTHQGHHRKHNEDHFLIVDVNRSLHTRQSSIGGVTSDASEGGTLVIVADGMGGHENGELASAVAIDTLATYVLRSPLTASIPDLDYERASRNGQHPQGFQAAALLCQDRILQVAKRKGANPNLGTTLTALYAEGDCAYLAHVGDSRAYLAKPDGRTWLLTHDHTIGASMQSHGFQAAEHLQGVLTNAICGTSEPPQVEALRLKLEPNDRLLLCSDGLTAYLEDPAIGAYLSHANSAQEAAEALVQLVLQTPAQDNVTAVVAFV